jgi:hypothetical protein
MAARCWKLLQCENEKRYSHAEVIGLVLSAAGIGAVFGAVVIGTVLVVLGAALYIASLVARTAAYVAEVHAQAARHIAHIQHIPQARVI